MQRVHGRWAEVALVMLVGACVTSCSSHREDAHEAFAFGRQAVTVEGTVIRKTARKVCQLIGDVDHETGLSMGERATTPFGIDNTDLGYPVADGNRTWFFFGDVTGASDIDPLGFTFEKPDPDDPTKCPKLEFTTANAGAAAQALTLHCDDPKHDGPLSGPLVAGRVGFNVPTGFALDPGDTPDKRRLIGLFAFGLTESTEPDAPRNTTPILAESSLADGHPAKDFTCIPTILASMPAQFAMIAPWIADVNELGYGFLPGQGSRVLLAYGTGIPARHTGVRLAAVRLGEERNPRSWRFFKGGSDDPDVAWLKLTSSTDPVAIAVSMATIANETTEIASQKTAGEISVSFDPSLHEWRMVHGVASKQLSPLEQGSLTFSPGNNVTIMRTAPRPEGPWVLSGLLYVMKDQGIPSWGDEGQGRFLHHENQRVWASADGLVPLTFDPPGPGQFPFACATSFPDYCSSIDIRAPQDPANASVGCCTSSDRCCDLAFHLSYGPAPGTWRPGVPYGQYLIPSFTRDRRKSDDPNSLLPHEQVVYWTLSTLNPYVVDLMSTDLAHTDWDHDGVPNEVDNCPLTFNDQANCNEEAEVALQTRLSASGQAREVKKLGDACDPVPCPKATMEVKREKLAVITGNCGTNPYTANVCIGRSIKDEIEHAPLGSGVDERLLTAQVIAPQPNTTIGNIETHARFCQSNPSEGYDCNEPLTKGDTELTVFDSDVAEERRGDHPWHRITIARHQCRTIGGKLECRTIRPVAGLRGDPFRLDFGNDESTSQWLYADDYDFWTTNDKIPEPVAAFSAICKDVSQYGTGTCLDGRVWIHGKTDVGKDDTHQTTPDGKLVGFHDAELTNHFIDVAPDRPFKWAYGGLHAHELFFIDFVAPDPPPVWREWEGASLPIVRERDHLVAVFADGHHEEADFLVASSSLRAKLFDPAYRWIQQVEASPFVGGRTAPQLVALSTDGTTLLTTVVHDAEGFREPGLVPCDTTICSPATLRSASASSMRAPAARSSFIPVYSREARRVFVVGGRVVSTGAASDELWTYRLEDGEWDKLDVPGLGDVVAATYSWRDRSLWVIARAPTDASHRKKRLIRFEPATGTVEVIATATPQGPATKYDELGLFLDMDGNVGVSASSDRAQKHRVALLTQRPGGYDVSITRRRDRALSAPPIVDYRGVVFFYEPDHPPTDPSKDPADDPVRGDRISAASRMRRLPLHKANTGDLEDLLR